MIGGARLSFAVGFHRLVEADLALAQTTFREFLVTQGLAAGASRNT